LIERTGELTCEEPNHPAQIAAKAIIRENFKYGDFSEEDVQCGTWDPVKYEDKKDDGYFEAYDPGVPEEEPNAMRIELVYDALVLIPSFFGSSPDVTKIRAAAIAKKSGPPIAVFSVAPALLALEEGALTNLLAG